MLFKKYRVKFYYWRQKRFQKKLLKNISKYYYRSFDNYELKDVFTFVLKNGLSVFPYNFFDKYFKLNTEVFRDIDGYPFVYYHDNKFFFKRNWSKSKVLSYFHGLLAEQDKDSPHLYCNDNFKVEVGDTIIDIGVAEGSFSFENINLAKSVMLFEKDESWIKVLNKTFEPFSDKVNIINKYVGEIDSPSYTRLDSFSDLLNTSVFIKIDVDGDEQKVINGMRKILENNQKIKIAICTYHKQNDFKNFSSYFLNLGFKVSRSNGYMLYYLDKSIKFPFFRRGVLRLVK